MGSVLVVPRHAGSHRPTSSQLREPVIAALDLAFSATGHRDR